MYDEDLDWDRVWAWKHDHPVVRAFAGIGREIAVRKGKLREPEAEFVRRRSVFLEGSLSRLLANTADSFEEELRQRLSPPESASSGPNTRSVLRRRAVGTAVADLPVVNTGEALGPHVFALAQLMAPNVRYWTRPVVGVVYAACSYALHEVAFYNQGSDERKHNQGYVDYFRSALKDRIITPMFQAGVRFPADAFLDFGTATMEGRRDLQGADFAVVLGLRVLGRLLWRVVLFQGKREAASGWPGVGEGDGDQLEELLSTGMGAYVFYPLGSDGRIFLLPVRPAASVFRDVWENKERPRWAIDPYGSKADPAVDIASFIAFDMADDTDLSLGRLFGDPKHVAAALSLGRPTALNPDVLVMDLTGELHVGAVLEQLQALGYRIDGVMGLPRADQPDASSDAEASHDGGPGAGPSRM